MIDTYMDRADAAAGYRPTPPKPVDRDDPCYWNGALYDSVINRMVAEAKQTLRADLETECIIHRAMIRFGFKIARAKLGVQA